MSDVMSCFDVQTPDKTRKMMIISINSFKNDYERKKKIDLYSALGDWMSYFQYLYQYTATSKVHCNKCEIIVIKYRYMNAIYVKWVTTSLEEATLQNKDIDTTSM